jgi:hypothetical protein
VLWEHNICLAFFCRATEDQAVSFRTATAKVYFFSSLLVIFFLHIRYKGLPWLIIVILCWLQSVYQWIIKPQSIIKENELFLPGRMSFIYNMVMP